jgi:hypothetical protein
MKWLRLKRRNSLYIFDVVASLATKACEQLMYNSKFTLSRVIRVSCANIAIVSHLVSRRNLLRVIDSTLSHYTGCIKKKETFRNQAYC